MIPNLRSLCCFWQMIKLGVIPPLGRETAAWIIQQQTEWLLKCEKETLLLALPGKEADATKKNRLLFISLSSSSRDVSPPFFGARNLSCFAFDVIQFIISRGLYPFLSCTRFYSGWPSLDYLWNCRVTQKNTRHTVVTESNEFCRDIFHHAWTES